MSNTIIVWFRNDLRIRDNEALHHAVQEADHILPIYCIDPRLFRKTTHFGLPKTGVFRANFLLQSLRDLQYSLQDLGGDLIVRWGKPEAVVFALAKYHNVNAVYCHQEATDEEIEVEEQLERNLNNIGISLKYFWGSTLFHYDDLPFSIEELPDIFTDFRKKMERKMIIRPTFSAPKKINLLPNVDSGKIPTLQELGLKSPPKDKRAVLSFKGGETQAWLRLKHYFWESKQLSIYKETRNGLLGADYSSKFSPWLANGTISPRSIFEELKRYEAEIEENKSTYWLFFELAWRDYFRFVAMKYENDVFKKKGLKQINLRGKQDLVLFKKWCEGQTGIPFVDANMRELAATGFMSNRGRQNVASFLVKDLGLDWRMGAEYFESK
ncbi:MAG: DASH family cryptochrome, partial [Chitinophagales bacterium]